MTLRFVEIYEQESFGLEGLSNYSHQFQKYIHACFDWSRRSLMQFGPLHLSVLSTV